MATSSNHVTYPWPSTLNVSQFVSVKPRIKDEDRIMNYKIWKEQMLCLLEGQGLMGFIDGGQVVPPENNTEPVNMLWRRTDRLIKGWILGSVGDDALGSVVGLESSREVWLEMEKIFNRENQVDVDANDQMNGGAPVLEEEDLHRSELEDNNEDPRSEADESHKEDAKVKDKEWHHYLPLYRASVTGDWRRAKETFDHDPNATYARIAFTLETALHIAVGTGKAFHFIKNLVNMMTDNALEITDELGYNALHVAALTGNTAASELLIERCPRLLYVPNNDGRFPINLSASSGHRETLEFLISKTRDDVTPSPYMGEPGITLLDSMICGNMFDLATFLIEQYPDLARSRSVQGFYGFRTMAFKQSAFSSGEHFNYWERNIYSRLEITPKTRFKTPSEEDLEDPDCKAPIQEEFRKWRITSKNLNDTVLEVAERFVPRVKAIRQMKWMHHHALEFVKCMCKKMETLNYMDAKEIYVDVMLGAAVSGIHEIIEVIVETFPAAIYSKNQTGQYIFHLAVENRCEKVFNLIYQSSELKNHYIDRQDNSGNNVLHLAAKLAPPHKLNLVSGAALQMQREIQWYNAVEKLLNPYDIEVENNSRKTPKMMFTEEHVKLKDEGEKWMKDTATSCSIAAALIITVVFAAAITVPGGNQSNDGGNQGKEGFPVLIQEPVFKIFAVSDVFSLFTSTTSLLMFLSILTSRYAEEDFLYALPKRLIIGLITLFLSISFMIAAFSATIYMVFAQEKAWILLPVGALSCLPITSFVLLQFPLLVDVVASTYGRGIFSKQSDRPFY